MRFPSHQAHLAQKGARHAVHQVEIEAAIVRRDEWLAQKQTAADNQAIDYLALVSAKSEHLAATFKLTRALAKVQG